MFFEIQLYEGKKELQLCFCQRIVRRYPKTKRKAIMEDVKFISDLFSGISFGGTLKVFNVKGEVKETKLLSEIF